MVPLRFHPSGGVHRPLVILFGWLGSKTQSYRRYQGAYADLGCDVWCRIATPLMVVESTYKQVPLTVPRMWPHHESSSSETTMEGLAWSILAEIDASTHPMVLFHVFSNGGCFLWDKIRSIFRLADGERESHSQMPHTPQPVKRGLEVLRDRIIGVVFDSCPGSDLHRLPDALKHCTFAEQLKVMFSSRYAFFHLASTQIEVESRAKEYMNSLTEDSWHLPQLYLYSEDDALAPSQSLDVLVNIRKKKHGSDIIWHKTWKESKHCSHFYHHPEDYREIISSFMKVCTQHSLTRHQRSRL